MESFKNDVKRSMTKYMLSYCSKELKETQSEIECKINELIEWEDILEDRIVDYAKEYKIEYLDKEALSKEEDIYFKNLYGNTIDELEYFQNRQKEVIESYKYFLDLLQVKE